MELHDDFLENFDNIPESVKAEMAVVIKRLETDAFYVPDREFYIWEKVADVNEYGCQGLDDWSGWALVWFFEYDSHTTTVPYPDTVVVLGTQAPAVRLRARNRKLR